MEDDDDELRANKTIVQISPKGKRKGHELHTRALVCLGVGRKARDGDWKKQ